MSPYSYIKTREFGKTWNWENEFRSKRVWTIFSKRTWSNGSELDPSYGSTLLCEWMVPYTHFRHPTVQIARVIYWDWRILFRIGTQSYAQCRDGRLYRRYLGIKSHIGLFQLYRYIEVFAIYWDFSIYRNFPISTEFVEVTTFFHWRILYFTSINQNSFSVSLWRRAYARNVRLYYPYIGYMHFISPTFLYFDLYLYSAYAAHHVCRVKLIEI